MITSIATRRFLTSSASMATKTRAMNQQTTSSSTCFVSQKRWMTSSDEGGSSGGDRLHSTDIAFKPAESGWGGGSKYSSNFDRIFGKNKQQAPAEEQATTDNTQTTSTQK